MTREDIIRMAREAGWPDSMVAPVIMDKLVEFATLVAAAEREACARVCEDAIANATDWDSCYWDQACASRAATIRERGKA